MTTSESFRALHRANPRAQAGFAQSVEAAAGAVRTRIETAPEGVAARPRRRVVNVFAASGASLVAAAAVALAVTSVWSRPAVEDATAAVAKAATVTAASAERSGTATVRITHDGELWAGSTIRWHGHDLALSHDAPARPGREKGGLRVVDGTLYGPDPGTGGWLRLGSPASIDPGSGTTPAEYLAAVREDTGGATLRRITGGMIGLTTSWLDDGSTVYSGSVAAGLIARESGFKEGMAIRVLPFGYVAHDEAADPSALLRAAVTVGADDVVRKIAVTWGAGADEAAWTYTVTYGDLGSTPAPLATGLARPLAWRPRTRD